MTGIRPRFSVICPAYQSGPRFAETIVSVLRQSNEDLELLIGDDGSTDMTVELAQAFADEDERVRLHQFPRTGDPGRVRANLITRARGDIIAYVDHDDLFHENHLADLDHALTGDRPIAITGAEYRHDGLSGAPMTRQGETWSPEIAIVDPVAEPSRVGHRRDLLAVATWRSASGGLEDWDLWWRLAMCDVSFTTLDRISATVRLHDGSRRHALRQRPTVVLGHAHRDTDVQALTAALAPRHREAFEEDLAQWPGRASRFRDAGAGSSSDALSDPPSWFMPSAMPGGPHGWILGFFAPVVDRAHAASIAEVMHRRFPRLLAAAAEGMRAAPEAIAAHPRARSEAARRQTTERAADER